MSRPILRSKIVLSTVLLAAAMASSAAAEDQIYFSAFDNIRSALVQRINAETVRIDMSSWYLTDRSVSTALVNRFKAGVQVRLLGDRASMFEIDALTKSEFYWLASQGVPIRLRVNPTWFPEIDHWKATIFAGQNVVAFGSANYTPFELAPASSTNYKDETVLFSDDPSIVNAFKTKFDVFWNDNVAEPRSVGGGPPYFKNWDDACASEPTGNCSDYRTRYPNPVPMAIHTGRLEPDYPMPADLIWGQGPDFNNRLVQEINNESSLVQLVVFRLTVDSITNALLSKFNSGVSVRVLVEPQEYLNRKWPEFWLTHANLDKLWAAGVPIKQRVHSGLTHMKTLVTSTYATNGSSNFAAGWQRDHNYFVPAATKPGVYSAIRNRVEAMWNDSSAFGPFQPKPPDAATLNSPASGATGVGTSSPLVWNIAAFAVSYDVYLGTSSSDMALVGNVPARLVNNPPSTYSWTPSSALQPGTTYFWKIVSRTNATPANSSLIGTSQTRSFTTSGTATSPPPPPPPSPSPSPSPPSGGTANDIVIYASDFPPSGYRGSWGASGDPSSPNGFKLDTPDVGVANTTSARDKPVDHVDISFSAVGGTHYRIWLRLKALGNSKWNDSVWVQFSDSTVNGSPSYRINTTSGLLVNLATDGAATSLSGWGWQNTAYWLSQATVVTFPTTGTRTLRIQVREDGVQLDQVVLSPARYMDSPPGSVSNDSTIVAKP